MTGFRIDERTRFELKAAELYTGCDTLQAVLELAVQEFLQRLREVEGFETTLRSAERALGRSAGVVEISDRHGEIDGPEAG